MTRKYQKRPRRIPKLQLHKKSGRGVVRLNGKDYYCGEYGTDGCQKEYDRLIAEWLTGSSLAANVSGLTIMELLADYLDHAKQYYTDAEGNITRSYDRCVETAKILNELYGDTLAAEFTSSKFKTFKKKLIDRGRCRSSANHLLVVARRIFKWGAAEEKIPEPIYRSVALVDNIRAGRSEARESEPVEPVSDAVVDETLKYLPPILATMVEVQRLTGMRPGEVCGLRPTDLDRSDTPWIYSPHKHKTKWRGKKRLVPVGPKARGLLLPYLDRDAEAYCFSPRERTEQFRATQRAARQSKVQPSQEDRSKRRPKRQPGLRYTSGSYGKAILGVIRRENAKRKAKELDPIPEWSPNQLRHNAGTKIRAKTDIDTARTVLGHGSVSVTEIYAEADLNKAKAYAEENG